MEPTTYRVRIVSGDQELQAEGDKEFVLQMLERFPLTFHSKRSANTRSPMSEPISTGRSLSVHGFARSVGSEKFTDGAADFLNRCDDDGRIFFAAFFEHQKTLAGQTNITWDHQSGFSMQFYFQRLGYVEMIWGFPAVNREGSPSNSRQRLVLPFDLASRRGVPSDFLDSFAQALAGKLELSGGPKRPSIIVTHLSPLEVEDVFSTVAAFVEKAAAL